MLNSFPRHDTSWLQNKNVILFQAHFFTKVLGIIIHFERRIVEIEYLGDEQGRGALAQRKLFLSSLVNDNVPRKGIEHAIKLVGLLDDPRCKLVISHDAGDEGFEYQHMLEELAHEERVDVRFISDRVADIRQLNKDGKKMYTLWDLYPHADLVTYPSIYEGFGNALLEALYFKVPVVVNRYSIFIQDIEPKGFRLPVMDGFVTNSVLKQVKSILSDREYRQQMVDHNYKLARKFYSYSVLRRSLRTIITSLTGLSPD